MINKLFGLKHASYKVGKLHKFKTFILLFLLSQSFFYYSKTIIITYILYNMVIFIDLKLDIMVFAIFF